MNAIAAVAARRLMDDALQAKIDRGPKKLASLLGSAERLARLSDDSL
jgi:hypothetical protein